MKCEWSVPMAARIQFDFLTMSDPDFRGTTTRFNQWSVNDIIQHLHDGDLMAAASIEGPEHFARFRTERQALVDDGQTGVQATRWRLGNLTGARLLERWHAEAIDLCNNLSV